MARIVWKNSLTGQKAQFVADTLNDSLFNYGFDSNKVPSLNLHFFCMDYLSTYKFVEDGMMQEGNMQPLNEEFEHIVNQSPWLPAHISSHIMLFRNKQGYYTDVQSEKNMEVKTKSAYYKESANYIIAVLNSDDNYLRQLLHKIRAILDSKSFSITEKSELYFCVREFCGELINLGYSKEHLYNRVCKDLFSKKTSNDDNKLVMGFLESLIAKREEYSVILGISDDVYAEFKDIVNNVRKASEEEKNKLAVNYVIETSQKSLDPVLALRQSKKSIGLLVNIYNACIHNDNMKVACDGLVRKSGVTQWSFINDSMNLLTKTQNKTKKERLHWTQTAIKRKSDTAILNALSLHNNALKTEEPQTQLLTLWTIFEVLIDSKQNFMSRSNHITNSLCSILCNSYFSHVIEALYRQISLSKAVKSSILTEPRGGNPIEKLAFVLKDDRELQNTILAALIDYPLEAYKFEHYITIFSSKEKMLLDLNRHSNRLRWQIMRIYRNRCMIVHNGKNMPYIKSVLENLHYYIDEVLNYVFSKIDIGIDNLEAIFSHARIKESSNIKLLEDKKKTITDDEYHSIIFDY